MFLFNANIFTVLLNFKVQSLKDNVKRTANLLGPPTSSPAPMLRRAPGWRRSVACLFWTRSEA